ncbi:ATP-dependent helicase HrpA [Oceanospirillum multiglobuliferum]|uniref:RNA helicase n=1 Tax=Oceanospirillum multiglobuliferum TaxID=64969 RepID=A0A1T4KDQ2_9GAMM|nr:ATP-dependent RNA helicase HrpA [Oceanospirillum multiglobuliferum]OPX56002.1 ATP-dependent RNA helicase HrpA [Oceanospirillum multiglobuliferum]SJZ40485.1 ATP-dependent helicase HrpA [Oceanospirillum multiglobuliferum]
MSSTENRSEISQLIKTLIAKCLLKDRFRLHNKLRQLQKHTSNSDAESQLALLLAQAQKSADQALLRKNLIPKIEYPENLPVSQKKEEIAEAIKNNQVVVIAGETGSGKTTQIPKICLELGLGAKGLIGHTQPRRLAARTVASRIAEELKVPLGEQVGYQVRFTDQVTENTLVKLMTDGILLAETQNDRFLNRYEVIIIDEAHERSLNIDFLLGILKQLLPKRPDLKLIITSATIDVQRFSEHFSNAPVIEVSGRTFPVDLLYRPLMELKEDEEGDYDQYLHQGIVEAVEEIGRIERERKWASGARDILIFLPGEREIREAAEVLRKAQLPQTEILPLYARLSAKEQNRVFQSHSGRRIVLTTNVAETSLTVPGIRYVIDPGTARISRYSYRSKVQRLPVEAISQASANQRKGRCGRISDGVCIRLYSEEDFVSRPEFTDPEIRRTNLASVILQMLNLRLGDVEAFPFVDAPDSRFIRDGFRLLHELGAVDLQNRLTPIGRQLAHLPIDPRIGRMVLSGAQHGALNEVLIIASALSAQDPRERPHDKQQASDERHKQWQDENSDFLAFVNLWQGYETQRQELSANALRKWCHKQYLSYLRLREWRDIHHQLRLMCKELKLFFNAEPADSVAVHQSLLSGLLGNLGTLLEDREYLGARNRKFYLFPGSVLYKKKPRWVMAADLVETSKLYARCVAKIEPEWIERYAKHLTKNSHNEPHWEKKRAQVVALENVSLYGLPIVMNRKVHYGPIDPVISREIFIRSALVEGQYQTQAAFFRHNQGVVAEIEHLESKVRRRDILIDDEAFYQFYDAIIPDGVYNGSAFEKWRKTAEKQNKTLLFASAEQLMQRAPDEAIAQHYPDQIGLEGMRLALDYQFEPGKRNDGVCMRVPVAGLQQINEQRLEWLVPGMLRDKCIALVKNLPKQVRKNFVPIPDYVDAVLPMLEPCDQSLIDMLAEQLRRKTGVRIAPELWQPEKLETHFHMLIQVVDSKGQILGESRNLAELVERFAEQSKEQVRISGDEQYKQSGLQHWPEGLSLPEQIEQEQQGIVLRAYPALVDQGSTVDMTLFDLQGQAEDSHWQGVRRLLMNALPQQVKWIEKSLPGLNQISLLFNSLGKKEQLVQDLTLAVFDWTFKTEAIPRDEESFNLLLAERKDQFGIQAEHLLALCRDILQLHHEVQKKLKGKIPLAVAFIYADIRFQLEQLVHVGFLHQAGREWLTEYPRYLNAILLRLEKAGINRGRDQMWSEELRQLWQKYHTKAEQLKQREGSARSLDLFRWMLEEYRVSLFAQQLGVKLPVSAKRIDKLWSELT